MNHVRALSIKFVMIAVVLLVVMTLLFEVPVADTLLLSVVLTVLAYATGDLMVFRKTGDRSEQPKRNAIATVMDTVLAFLVLWLLGAVLNGENGNLVWAALVSAVVIAGGEWFFHKYLDKNIFPEKRRRNVEASY